MRVPSDDPVFLGPFRLFDRTTIRSRRCCGWARRLLSEHGVMEFYLYNSAAA